MFDRSTKPNPRFAAFTDLPAAELETLERLITPITVPAGETIMTQGAFGNEAHLLLDGQLLVQRDGQEIAILGAGAIVGETAVLLNEPRSATVVAATDTTIAVMTRREFSSMLETCPTLARRVLNSAVGRAAKTSN